MLTLVKSDSLEEKVSDEVLIHVRYLPNSDVMTIDNCPPHLAAQEWCDLLLKEGSEHYQTFAGARGFFRLPRHAYDAIRADATPMAAE